MDEKKRMRRVWRNIKDRCYRVSSPEFHNYGGRGIFLAEEWHDFSVFYRDIMADIGARPSPRHSLDRIDNDRGYEPGNLRWATPQQQCWNSRQTVWVTFRGERAPLKEAARRLGIDDSTLRARIRRHGLDAAFRMQRRNVTRRTVIVDGKEMSVRRAAMLLGISDVGLMKRIKRHGPEKAVALGARHARRAK